VTTPRRPRTWNDVRVNQIVAAGGSSVPVDLGINLAARDVKTVVRIILDLCVFPDDRNAAIDGVAQIECGIGVASLEAFTAQVVPNPRSQSEYPALGWLYVNSRCLIFNNSSGTIESWDFPQWHADIRANRKVDKGRLYFTWDNTTADAAGISVTMVGRIRSLFLL